MIDGQKKWLVISHGKMQSETAEKIANLARSKILGGKILSIKYSDKTNPHFARILIQNYQNKRVAIVAALVVESPENLLTFSLLWFQKFEKLKTKPAEKLWIVSNNPATVAKLCTALNEDWQNRIRNFDFELTEKFPEETTLKKIKSLQPPKTNYFTEKIISLAPQSIQHCGSHLSFNGLPFVRFTKEKIIFGIENTGQILSEGNWRELVQLVENLAVYRNHKSPNRKHAFYNLLPEAWLESILQSDISTLDPNLILSPLHNQFRASAEQIDLLAIRKDGRLVIIELKVSPNREHLFQAVDYWQEIEKHRRAGNLRGLFGKQKIADIPTLVYLAAPHSCYHKDFDFLAGTLSDQIEIYRIDINERWRKDLRVLERKKV